MIYSATRATEIKSEWSRAILGSRWGVGKKKSRLRSTTGEDDPVDFQTRSSDRAADRTEKTAMGRLVRSIAKLTPRQRAKVGFDDRLMAEVDRLVTMPVNAAYGRQVRTITSEMRRLGLGEKELQAAYDRGRGMSLGDESMRNLAERWLASLLSGGDESLHRFCESFADVDRSWLRQSLRSLNKDNAALADTVEGSEAHRQAKQSAMRTRKKIVAVICDALGDMEEIPLP